MVYGPAAAADDGKGDIASESVIRCRKHIIEISMDREYDEIESNGIK
jgi:hypothetical protein